MNFWMRFAVFIVDEANWAVIELNKTTTKHKNAINGRTGDAKPVFYRGRHLGERDTQLSVNCGEPTCDGLH